MRTKSYDLDDASHITSLLCELDQGARTGDLVLEHIRTNAPIAVSALIQARGSCSCTADQVIEYMQTWQCVSPAASALGKLGRAKNTPAQQAAAKANGKKGGRPKKVKPPELTEYEKEVIKRREADYQKQIANLIAGPLEPLKPGCIALSGGATANLTTREIVKEIPRTANRAKIAARSDFHGFTPDDCCICGRATNRKGGEGHWVIMTEGGTHMAKIGTEDHNNPGFMAEYAVGSSCAKKFAKELEGYLIIRE